ncbi:unnamed protein product [Heligmosomoides polygyrus]|uniref:Uncharacterized protein n=1 Tax=Heligmosomoides polygyrus TaxID=6339 RepID=A0A3P7X8L3_HELPZ|nr:unnamed protein product [Heligmosomoides polygyrus]
MFSSRVLIGTLAFATATQQLYIKVNNGWKEVMLGAFYPIVEQRQSLIHLIALNTPFDGNMHGMRGADLQCYREARMAGFTTTFRAMLSSNVQDMLRIVHTADWDTPVVNIRGEHLFASWRAVLNDGQRSARPLYSFDRRDVLTDSNWPDKRTWHGSKSGGIRAGDYCDGWRSNYGKLIHCHRAILKKRSKQGREAYYNSLSSTVLCLIQNMSKYHGDRILKKKRMGELVW